MKKLLLSLLACLFLLAGCSPESRLPEDYAVGVVRTSGSRADSDILYFDEALQQTGFSHFRYAGLGHLFYPPFVFEDTLCLVPEGPANRKDAKTVLTLDLESLAQKTYPLDRTAIYSACADEAALYAASNLNGQSFVSRLNREDGSVAEAVYDGVYISLVYPHRGLLCAFAEESAPSGTRCRLLLLDPETLAERASADISGLGSGVYSAAVEGDTLYFAPMNDAQGGWNAVVGVYDAATGETGTISFPQPVFRILCADGLLYASHGNPVTGEGSALSVYDPAAGETVTYDLGMWPGQIALGEGCLYVMDDSRIVRFDLRTMERLAEAAIPLDAGEYLSGVFAR